MSITRYPCRLCGIWYTSQAGADACTENDLMTVAKMPTQITAPVLNVKIKYNSVFKGILADPTPTLAEGSTTNPVTIRDLQNPPATKSYTATNGAMVVDSNLRQFEYDSTNGVWHLRN